MNNPKGFNFKIKKYWSFAQVHMLQCTASTSNINGQQIKRCYAKKLMAFKVTKIIKQPSLHAILR